MVSAARAFAKEPPLKPLTNMKRVVKDFKWRYQDRLLTDQVVVYCAEADSFVEAVRRAVEARDANGKHHNHQSKVDITARRKFGARIVKRRKRIEHMREFDRIHDCLDSFKPYGVGPVTVYDVAVRLGAYMGIVPQSVYLHAGVRLGLKALMPDDPEILKLKRVPLDMFPKELAALPADDVEDILCTYREVFMTWQ
jgi:hypothetical protein